MKFEWDEAKAETNRRKHSVAFAEAARFEFGTAVFRIDDDIAYGEERIMACGFIGPRLHVLIYVERGEILRIISLRRATQQEKRTYEDDVNKGW